MKPTPRHVDALVARITDSPWRTYRDGLLAHLDRERRAGDTEIDGYPTRHGAPGTGGSEGIVVDGDRIPATGVEIAAINRIELGSTRDEHRRRTFAILRELDRIVEAINAIDGHFRNLGELEKATSPDGSWCEHHLRSIGACEPLSDRYRGLCRWCGDFRAANGELPPVDIIERRQRGERITQNSIA